MEAFDKRSGAINSEANFIDPALVATGRNEIVLRIVLGVPCSVIAMLFMLVSFLPTNYNWDPGMPDYSDPDAMSRAMLTSGFTVILAAIGIVLLWRWKLSVILFSVILAIGIYRFTTLLYHFSG